MNKLSALFLSVCLAAFMSLVCGFVQVQAQSCQGVYNCCTRYDQVPPGCDPLLQVCTPCNPLNESCDYACSQTAGELACSGGTAAVCINPICTVGDLIDTGCIWNPPPVTQSPSPTAGSSTPAPTATWAPTPSPVPSDKYAHAVIMAFEDKDADGVKDTNEAYINAGHPLASAGYSVTAYGGNSTTNSVAFPNLTGANFTGLYKEWRSYLPADPILRADCQFPGGVIPCPAGHFCENTGWCWNAGAACINSSDPSWKVHWECSNNRNLSGQIIEWGGGYNTKSRINGACSESPDIRTCQAYMPPGSPNAGSAITSIWYGGPSAPPAQGRIVMNAPPGYEVTGVHKWTTTWSGDLDSNNDGQMETGDVTWEAPTTAYNAQIVRFGIRQKLGCSVDMATTSYNSGQQIQVRINGHEGREGRSARLYLQQRDGTQLASLPTNANGTAITETGNSGISAGKYYYYIDECTISGGSCVKDINLDNMPDGEFYFSCLVDNGGGQFCSGNPFCSYESPNPAPLASTIDCSTVNSVSCDGPSNNKYFPPAKDNIYFDVTPAGLETVTVNVYEAPSAGVCSGTTALPPAINSVDVSVRGPAGPPITLTGYSNLKSSDSFSAAAGDYYSVSSDTVDPLGAAYRQSCSPVGILVGSGLNIINLYYGPSFGAWFQAKDGDVAANSGDITSIIPPTCILGTCFPHLMLESTEQGQGVIQASNNMSDFGSLADANVTQKLGINTENYLAEDVGPAIDTSIVPQENFDYFMRLFEMPEAPQDDWDRGGSPWSSLTVPGTGVLTAVDGLGLPVNPLNPVSDSTFVYYYSSAIHGQDLVYDGSERSSAQQYTYETGEKVVIFVEGNLILRNFGSGSAYDHNIVVDPGGFLSFIVSGDITFEDTVGNTAANYGTTNIHGVFIADGSIITDDTAGNGLQLGAKGTYVGWGGVSLGKTLLNTDNNENPAELFTYDPVLIMNAPDEFRRSRLSWQEVAPFDFSTLP